MGKRDLSYYKKYQPKVDYIDEYAKASNAASGSKFDANSNVETKNVTTLTGEIHKGDEIGVNPSLSRISMSPLAGYLQ